MYCCAHKTATLTPIQHTVQRSQKKRRDPLNMLLEIWCAKIGPNLKEI